MSSVLRDALRNRAQTTSGSSDVPKSALRSRDSANSTARSFRSVGRTLASAFSRSGEQKKRRRPPISQLGVPEFFLKDPPPASLLDGVDSVPAEDYGPNPTAHARSLKDRTGKPWISLVLWSHAGPRSAVPLYYENESVRGELRVHADRAEAFSEISVWLLGSVYERGSHGSKILSLQACVWPPHGKSQSIFSRKLKVKGTHVWPITFHLPPDVAVFSELAQAASGKGWARVPLPPSMLSKLTGFGVEVSYTVTVDTDRSKERLEIPLRILPRSRPIPRLPVLFPFMPTPDEWPFSREIINGWSFTPFGGRGRFRKEAVEVDGLIGIQHPAVFGPGDTINFKMMLSSSNSDFLQVMSSPYFVRAELTRAIIVGDGALNASYGLHDRTLQTLFCASISAEGAVAVVQGAGRSSTPSLEDDVDFSSHIMREAPRSRSKPCIPPYPLRTIPEPNASRASSPTESESEEEEVGLGSAKVVRMEGRVHLPSGRMMKPSFRFEGVAVEYLIIVTFTPPDYVHGSPRGSFQAECPVWLCSDSQHTQMSRLVPRQPVKCMIGESVDVTNQRVTREHDVIGGTPARERRTRY